MLRDLWIFLMGFGSALALLTGARGEWLTCGITSAVVLASVVVVRRGLFGISEETINRVEDGTTSFRRAHLALVRREE
jgi:hypothetical protein